MAKRVHKAADVGSGPGGDQSTVKTISEQKFKSLVTRCKSAQSAMDSERGSLGSMISDAVENNHLHKGAFGMFRRIDKMDPGKRAELLFHFDVYRERAEKRSGPDAWSAQPDMFRDEEGDGDDADDGEPAQDGRPGLTGEALGAAIDAANGDGPDHDDKDLRPRHLRTGSAVETKPH